jgi:hypothetical protein
VKFWFIYSSDFKDIECRRVEKVERDEGSDPDGFMDSRDASAGRKNKETYFPLF